MLKLTRTQIDAIRTDALLNRDVAAQLPNGGLVRKLSDLLVQEEWDAVHDAALDVLVNSAPVVEGFEAEQDKGAYTVTIHGILGAYFVQAMEYEDLGVFSTIEEARSVADFNYREFRVKPT